MKITKERLKEIIKDVLREETEYQKFFKKALEKSGKSIPQMSDDEKKAFFNSNHLFTGLFGFLPSPTIV